MGFVAVERLVRRLRPEASRRDELARLKARHRAQPGPREVSEEARACAERLRALRREMAEALAEAPIEGCATCAKGHPLPAGRWSGGHCCGGDTLTIFSAAEVASLKLAGTRRRDWRPPVDDHAGCVFRGATGCSLHPEDRPSICLQYICLDLRRELREDEGRWKRLARLAAALRDEHARFERALVSPVRGGRR